MLWVEVPIPCQPYMLLNITNEGNSQYTRTKPEGEAHKEHYKLHNMLKYIMASWKYKMYYLQGLF